LGGKLRVTFNASVDDALGNKQGVASDKATAEGYEGGAQLAPRARRLMEAG